MTTDQRFAERAERIALWESAHNLAISLAARRTRTLPIGCDRFACAEDLRQSALAALWEATDMWEPGAGLSFSSYAYRVIRGAVQNSAWAVQFWGFNGNRAAYLKEFSLLQRNNIRIYGNWSTSPNLRDADIDVDHPNYLPPDHTAARDVVEVLLSQIPSTTERECVRLYYIDGLTTKQISERLGLSIIRIEQARPAGIKRMRLAAARMGLYDE